MTSAEGTGRKALTELRESISKCDVAARIRLERLVGGALVSSGTGATVPYAGETGGESGRVRQSSTYCSVYW